MRKRTGKIVEILISGADCKSDRTSRVDERGRDGRGLTVDAVLRAKLTKNNGRNYSALGKEKKKGFSFGLSPNFVTTQQKEQALFAFAAPKFCFSLVFS